MSATNLGQLLREKIARDEAAKRAATPSSVPLAIAYQYFTPEEWMLIVSSVRNNTDASFIERWNVLEKCPSAFL